MSRMLLMLAGCALLLNTACSLVPPPTSDPATQTATVFVLVRHAERPPETPENPDPSLTAEGQERAAKLTEIMLEAGVDVIYTTDLARNRETVAALAQQLNITPVLVNPARYVNTTLTAQQIVDEVLAAHRGKTILFCGNRGSLANTPGITDQIWRRLGGSGPNPDRYRHLYLAILPPDADVAAQFLRLEYGGESSLDPP